MKGLSNVCQPCLGFGENRGGGGGGCVDRVSDGGFGGSGVPNGFFAWSVPNVGSFAKRSLSA